MFAEHAAHGKHTLARFRRPHDVEDKSQCAEETFVANQSSRLKQVHRRSGLRLNFETSDFQQVAPFPQCQRSRAAWNVARHFAADFLLNVAGKIVRREAQFMDAITSARLQQSKRLGHNPAFCSSRDIVNIAPP